MNSDVILTSNGQICQLASIFVFHAQFTSISSKQYWNIFLTLNSKVTLNASSITSVKAYYFRILSCYLRTLCYCYGNTRRHGSDDLSFKNLPNLDHYWECLVPLKHIYVCAFSIYYSLTSLNIHTLFTVLLLLFGIFLNIQTAEAIKMSLMNN